MLSKWLTEILVLLAVGLGVACVCLWLHEHDIYLFRSFWKRVRKMSIIGLCAAVLWAVPFVQLGGTKGDGGTGTTGILPVDLSGFAVVAAMRAFVLQLAAERVFRAAVCRPVQVGLRR